jgi:hypothetical protein
MLNAYIDWKTGHHISIGIWWQYPARAKFKMQVAVSNDSHARKRMLV